MRAILTMLGAALAFPCLLLAGLCAYAFCDRSWLWRNCFNALGCCWDSATEQVYVEQAGAIRGGGTLLFLALALVLIWPAIMLASTPRRHE